MKKQLQLSELTESLERGKTNFQAQIELYDLRDLCYKMYASGKGAEVIVWIVKRARDEHRQAIEWLNQHTDSNIGFFPLEIELWQIGD